MGSGFNGTTAGKIYLSQSLNYEGDLAITYCNGKIYMRKFDLSTGILAIYNPETLLFESKVKLHCGDLLSKASLCNLNKFFPLMSPQT